MAEITASLTEKGAAALVSVSAHRGPWSASEQFQALPASSGAATTYDKGILLAFCFTTKDVFMPEPGIVTPWTSWPFWRIVWASSGDFTMRQRSRSKPLSE